MKPFVPGTNRMLARLALSLLCASGVLSASAQTMYKWVDEKGVTHFSEIPPPDGVKGAAKIEVRPASPDKAPVDNWKQREMESKQRRAVESNQQEAARKQEEQQRVRKCRQAQRDADLLTNSQRIFHLNDKGERVYMEESQRAAELAEARREIARSCP